MSKAKFKPLRRKTSFPCIGVADTALGGYYAMPHDSKGTPHTLNNEGPMCANCVKGYVYLYGAIN